MYVRSHEWLPTGSHAPHWRLEAASAIHGALKTLLRTSEPRRGHGRLVPLLNPQAQDAVGDFADHLG